MQNEQANLRKQELTFILSILSWSAVTERDCNDMWSWLKNLSPKYIVSESSSALASLPRSAAATTESVNGDWAHNPARG